LIRGTNILELKIFNIVQSPKSPIRKNSSDDSIFYQTDIEIADNGIDNLETGFFFLYNAEKDAEVMLKDATNIMAKSGIGGERNNMGRIMPDPVFGDFNPGIHSYMYSNISVISPKDLNDFAKIKWYKTFIRGGRKLNNGNQYKTVRMIKEGADVSMDTEGQMVEIGIDDNNNMALRYGKAFLIPYKNEK
jgi:CRISPR type III-A-associated RAMP protein Csm4